MTNTININGQNYIERWQIIPFQQAVTVALGQINAISVTLPGAYDFRLKALGRDTVSAAGATVDRRFTCQIGNTDGSIWYSQAGVGGVSDQVLDSLLFGNAAFPYVIIPELYYTKNGAIKMNITDVSNTVPYTINFAFYGAYLIPVG